MIYKYCSSKITFISDLCATELLENMVECVHSLASVKTF